MWASIIPSAISVLGGVFGGKAQTIPYTNQIQGALGSAGTQAQNISNLGSQAQNAYNQFSPQANAAIENYARYLQQNPYTSAYSTALLNRATSSTTAAYQQAKSQLQADLASRGMSGSGYEAGALGTIDASQAQAMANAQNNLALTEIGQLGQNQANLVGLFSGAANNAFGQASSNFGNAAGIYDNIASQYANLGENQEKYDVAQQQRNQGLIQSGLTGLGSALGQYLDGDFNTTPTGNNTGVTTSSGSTDPATPPNYPFGPSYDNIYGTPNYPFGPNPTLAPYYPPGTPFTPLQASRSKFS